MSRQLGHAVAVAALTLVFLLVPRVPAMAQSEAASGTAQAQQGESSKPETPGQELAHQSNEASGENDALKHSPSVRWLAKTTGLSLEGAYWLGQAINFGVIALGIIWLSRKHLPGVFRGRTVSIQKAMEEARHASEDAQRRLSDIESRLSRLDGELSEMRGAAERDAAAEQERILAAAAEDARKIVAAAEQEIAAAGKAARRELTAYAADLAVSVARKKIQVDTATDEALVRTFAEQLSSNGGKGGN